MKHLKLFEAWNKRFPQKTTLEEIKRKKDIHGIDNWSEKENEFLNKLIAENKSSINFVDEETEETGYFYIELYNMGNVDDPDDPNEDFLIRIELQKFKDNWFSLYVTGLGEESGYYLCDEFEEIEGFLGTYTHLRF